MVDHRRVMEPQESADICYGEFWKLLMNSVDCLTPRRYHDLRPIAIENIRDEHAVSACDHSQDISDPRW